MRNSPIGRSLMAAALLMAAGSATASAVEQRRTLRDAHTPYSNGIGHGGGVKRGPGWSRAQVKRMAKKRRNVIRNRKAQRG